MSLELKGKLIKKLDIESGESQRGVWKKQNFIIETKEQYPRQVCITLWGDKLDLLNGIEINDDVKAYINVESREYNGRWYTDVKAWRLEKDDQKPEVPQDLPDLPDEELPLESEIDDLPF